MNKFFIFFFVCVTMFSQVSFHQYLEGHQVPLTYNSNDTILGLPLFSNNLHVITKYPITDWYNLSDNTIDFENYISDNKDIEIIFFLDNNIFSFGLPVRESYFSFGLNHHVYGNAHLSNELLSLFWNGNSQYLNQTIEFFNNRSSFMQFSSIYFQYYFQYKDYQMGARFNFLHGINYFNLERGNFTLNSVSNLITPFSTYVSTNIYARTSNSNLIGFSNPGLSLDYAVNFHVKNFNFSMQLENLGFIYWNRNIYTHNSNDADYLFNGFDYTMDEVVSEELENTLDTLSDIFAINSEQNSNFIKRIPLKFTTQASIETSSDSELFVKFKCIEYWGRDGNIDFLNMYFIGASKAFNDKITLYSAFNYNKFSPTNLSLGVFSKFDNFIFKLNTNNLFSLFSKKYFHISTALYYIF